MAEHEIKVTIGAKDEASKAIKAIDKQLTALQKEKATIEVDAETKDASKKLAAVEKQIVELQTEKAEIEVEAKVTGALRALDEVAGAAEKADQAARELSRALGPELAGTADMDAIVRDFERAGLTLDEVIANADRLGAKLKEIGSASTGGLEATLSRSRRGVEDIGRSADSSKSALANMVGNAAQDVGSLGGIAGSAGVAIGQMAEYMADASFSGEKFSSVLKNFATVAGPILAITAVLGGVTNVMGELRAEEEASAQRTKDFGKAMEDAAIDAVGLQEALAGDVEKLREFDSAGTGFLDRFNEKWTRFVRGIPLAGSALGDVGKNLTDLIPIMEAAGLNAFDVSKAIAGSSLEWSDAMLAAKEAGVISADQYLKVREAIQKYREEAKAATEDQEFFNVSIEQANAILKEMAIEDRPLEHFTDQWKTLTDDMRDGEINTQAAADAMTLLKRELGLTEREILKMIRANLDEEMAKGAKATEDYKNKMLEAHAALLDQADAAEQFALAVSDTQVAVEDLGGAFAGMERRSEAMASIFDLGNAPAEALEATVDINEAIRDLGQFIKDEGMPDLFDPNDVDVQPFLAKISALREPIQAKITEAFGAGGPEAARQMAAGYLTQLVDSLKGQLTRAQVLELFPFLSEMEVDAVIKLAVDAADLALAQQTLELLVGLRGQTPYTASIALALATKQITPQAAQALINAELAGAGVTIPGTMTVDSATALAEAQTFAEQNKVDWPSELQSPENIAAMVASVEEILRRLGVTVPSKMGDPTGIVTARNNAQRVAAGLPPIVFPARVGVRGMPVAVDTGSPSVPWPGGIAAEKRPEIINRRWLATEPVYVPPGTHVTSGKQTARILRTRGHRGLRRYDQGGTVAGPTTLNVTVNSAVVGNAFEVTRAVRRATVQGTRLFGSRGA